MERLLVTIVSSAMTEDSCMLWEDLDALGGVVDYDETAEASHVLMSTSFKPRFTKKSF